MANSAKYLRKSDIEGLFPAMCQRFALRGKKPIGEPSGFGAVWVALDTWLDREVAIKLSDTDLSDEIVLCRDIEGQTVRIFDYFRGEGEWNAYAMELLQAPWMTLSSFIGKHKYKPNDLQHYFDCFEIVYDVLQGLNDIHGRPYSRKGRYVHADIKPANLFLYCRTKKHRNTVFRMPVHDQVMKIIDMGISTERGELNLSGTPAYDYPKKLEARPGHDLYALGVMFLEMLGGELPEHETMAHKARIAKSVSVVSSGSKFVDDLAIELIRKCARAAAQPNISAANIIDFLDKKLFDLDPAILLSLRAINKKPENKLSKNEMAEFLFYELSGFYGWSNRTAGRIDALKTFIADIYDRNVLVRDGHSYYIR
jgi:serine/threonine protein kinase